MCQSHTGRLTGLWFLPKPAFGLNTNDDDMWNYFSLLSCKVNAIAVLPVDNLPHPPLFFIWKTIDLKAVVGCQTYCVVHVVCNINKSSAPFLIIVTCQIHAVAMYVCVVRSKIFRPDQLFKGTEIKQLCYFSTQSPFISTHFSHLWTSNS